MKLIILGENSDDKGTQLEQLTVKMLEHQGFVDIVPNKELAGSNEIDASAVMMNRIGGRDVPIPVMCKCKAYNNPIILPDWLKFLGKLSIARKRNPQTIGLMIALNGANGAVMGCIEQDFNGDETVQLIANTGLVNILSEIYKLPTANDIRIGFASSPFTVEDVFLVYYRKHFYWMVSTMNNQYTILEGNGDYLEPDKIKKLMPLINKETQYSEDDYFDINEAIDREMMLQRLRMRMLLECIENPHVTLESFINATQEMALTGISPEEFFDGNNLMIYEKENQTISLHLDEERDLVEFYRKIYAYGQVEIELLQTEFYQNHINERLLEKISEIQYGLKLPEEYIGDILFILKHSPSAMRYAIYPDSFYHGNPIIANSDNGMVQIFQTYFMERIANLFRRDFTNQRLGAFFLDEDIDMMRVETRITIGDRNVMCRLDTRQNLRLARISEFDQVAVVVTKDDM